MLRYQNPLRLAVFFHILALVFMARAHANIIVGGFTGQITAINDPDGWFDGYVELGQLISGTVVYDDVPSSTTTAGPGTTYLFFDWGQNMYLNVGDELFATDLGVNVKIYNNDPVVDDRYGYVSTSDNGFPFDVALPFRGAISVHLDDPTRTALVNENFTPILPTLDDFPVAAGDLRILEFVGSIANTVASADFSVDTFVPVPEPATSVSLLLVGCIGLIRRLSTHRVSL